MEEVKEVSFTSQGQSTEKKEPLLKKFPRTDRKNLFLISGSLLIVLAGVATGWVLSGIPQGKSALLKDIAPGAEKPQTEAGISDGEEFPDTEGILEEGGIEGEGTHHLVREGGPARYVYLTSTVINLQDYVGKTVQVWGETIAGRHAGWLMDVERLKVLD